MAVFYCTKYLLTQYNAIKCTAIEDPTIFDRFRNFSMLQCLVTKWRKFHLKFIYDEESSSCNVKKAECG